MIWKNYTYKWIDFSASTQASNKDGLGYLIMLMSDSHQTILSTNETNNANTHGGYLSETLAWPRKYTFEWYIYWETFEKRSIARNQLIAAIQPEFNPWSNSRGFYDLTYEDGEWNQKTVKAKVVTAPEEIASEPCSTSFDFRFELETEKEKIDWDATKTASGWIGILWWVTFSTTFPNTFSWYWWTIICTNNWNRKAPMKISVVWNIVNPKIINTTNRQKYRIDKTTTNLIFDNRNLDNDPKKRLVVTDSGIDIRWYRNSWASIYLDPGENKIVVIWDSYDQTTTVNITFKDSRLY